MLNREVFEDHKPSTGSVVGIAVAFVIVGLMVIATSSSRRPDEYRAFGTDRSPLVMVTGQPQELPQGDNLNLGSGNMTANVGTFTSSTLTSSTITSATLQKLNTSPANSMGKIGWQSADVCSGQHSSQCTVYNDWPGNGNINLYTKNWVNASDNQGTLIAGICTSPTSAGSCPGSQCCTMNSTVKQGDWFKLCNGAGPLDDGVVMLSNEDGRAQTVDQIILPNTGVPGQGVQMEYPIPPGGACATIEYDEYDHINHPGVLRWHIDDSNSRQPNITAGYIGYFPDAIFNGAHGTYDNLRPGNAATALGGPQGYSTTIAVASNGQALAGGNNTYTINVVSTAGFVSPNGNGGASPTLPIVIGINHGGTVYSFTCGGIGSTTTFTTCGGAAVTLSTGDVVSSGLCDAGTTCSWDETTAWTFQGTDSSTVIVRGLYYGGNAKPTGEGPTKRICNAGPGPLQFNNNDANSSTANQISFYTGANVTVALGQCIDFWHSTLYTGKWQSPGVLPYTAGTSIAVSSANVVSVSVAGATCSGAGQALTSQTTGAAASCSAVPFTLLNRQVLTANSGTYTPTSGTKRVLLEMVGQGGGGGGCTSSASGVGAGAGGASGSYFRQWIDCSGTCSTAAYTNGNTGGAGVSASNGTNGQDTTFGPFNSTTYTARGGGGGAAMTTSASAAASQGGGFVSASSSGDAVIEAVPGGNGISTGAVAISGSGGSNLWGGGGKGEASYQGGAFVSHGNGAGGAGAFCTNNSTALAGGNATIGLIIVTEYN